MCGILDTDMSSDAQPPHLTDLLSQTHWVRLLAGHLVRDPHAADDLAQEVCLAAIDRPPERPGNMRAWLRTVMHNVLLQQKRSSSRRRLREFERELEFSVTSESTQDLVERAQVHRSVVDAVLALSPPLRDSVLLRYFEQLMPRAIAKAMNVPVATVHSRLQRAHARLRESLDDGCDQGRGWRCALLPLPCIASSPYPAVVVLAMKTKVVSVVAAVAIGSAVFWFVGRTGANANDPSVAPVAPVASHAEVGSRAGAAGSSEVVDRVAVELPTITSEDPSPVPARQCRGRVVDAEGRAVSDIFVQVAEAKVASDSAGMFEAVTSKQQAFNVHSAEPAWHTVLEGSVRDGEDPPPVLLVVAPAIKLAGHVRSSDGTAVSASVRVVLPAGLRARLNDISDVANEVSPLVRSGVDGEFQLSAGAVRGAELLVLGNDCVPHRRPLPMASDGNLEIVLERLVHVAGSLQGQVVDIRGRAVALAYVALGRSVARSDERGNFVVPDDGESDSLTASAAGFRRGVMVRGADGFSPFVVLTLGATPLAISGRVVDENGKGLAGVAIWPNDPTALGNSRSPMVAEGIAAGCVTSNELRQRFERGEFAGQQPQQVMRENPTVMWPFVISGSDGSFRLGGLEERAYRLRAMDNDTLLMTQVEDIVAGRRDVQLVLDQSQLFDEVAGVIVSRDGSPIAGARITVQIDTQSLQGNTMHGRGVATVTSNQDGTFRLSRVPRQRAYFRIDGDNILPCEPGRRLAGGLDELSGGRPQNMRIEVGVRVHVQVEVLDANRADSIAVLDDKGEPVMLNVFEGRSRSTSGQLQLSAGRSAVFVVPDAARTLVLRKGGVEVGREAIQLRAGDVNVLRF